MPTSATSTSNERRRREGGFTLIEIGLVLLIIATVVALVVPRFRDQSLQELQSQTRKLAATFRFLQEEAILNGRVYRLNFDLDQQRYFVTEADLEDESAFTQTTTGVLSHDVILPSTVQIADVDTPESGGKLYEGVALAHFFPDGFVEPMAVHLQNGQEFYTLYVANGLTGRAHVAAGYIDLGAPS
jgi:general secretion pathway protein H